MRHPLPAIRQSVQYLKKLLRKTPDARAHQRLLMLYLFKSEQAHRREDAADLLSVHRNTITAWLKEYERAGIKGLLTVGTGEGAPPALDVSDQKALRKRLTASDGFASYADAQQWIETNLGVRLSYASTYYWVHYKCGAAPKVARPSHIKKTTKPSKPTPA
jgi:transposase